MNLLLTKKINSEGNFLRKCLKVGIDETLVLKNCWILKCKKVHRVKRSSILEYHQESKYLNKYFLKLWRRNHMIAQDKKKQNNNQKTLCLKERNSQKRNTQNLNFKEENSCRFYSWGLQRAVVKKKFVQ